MSILGDELSNPGQRLDLAVAADTPTDVKRDPTKQAQEYVPLSLSPPPHP
jgi:hypothetical protein